MTLKTVNHREKLIKKNCRNCGHIIYYADDTNYVAIGQTRYIIERNIEEKLMKIKIHLNANRLTINLKKITILETMVKQKRCKIGGSPSSLEVVTIEGGEYSSSWEQLQVTWC